MLVRPDRLVRSAARAALACFCVGRAITVSVFHGIAEVTKGVSVASSEAGGRAHGAAAPRGDAIATAASDATGTLGDGAAGVEIGIEASGRVRPVISDVRPSVDGGRYPAKASLGLPVVVTADVFTDGHDQVACTLLFRHEDEAEWTTAPMVSMDNDRWTGDFVAEALGTHLFCLRATVDWFGTWHHDLAAKAEAGQPVDVELLVGSDIVAAVAERAEGQDAVSLREWADALHDTAVAAARGDAAPGLELAASAPLFEAVGRWPDPVPAATSDTFRVLVDRERARFSAWYEMFPRSASPDFSRAGTLADTTARLPYVAAMGFDTLYLPPIHPVGTTNRKGRDGSDTGELGDPGSPWAIGSAAGGHTDIDPALGTFVDLDRLVRAAADLGIDVALDLAFQCSPNHPWVSEHPEWFRHLPDGSIRYAENPPKRYQDVYPLDFGTEAWRDLWAALHEVVRFWIARGVRVFRVDNPHTKPMRFWEWLIPSVKSEFTDVIFLSEAFTRPRIMEYLAKIGFCQSYTYFTWRNTKSELESYLTELTRTDMADYFRPNLWPNTPDILHETLQAGGRATFVARLVLAATLASNYGIYGPAFELQEHVARSEGSEEYLHSEKYEVRHWDLARPDNLAPLIATVNAARRAHPALQHNRTLRFHHVDNDGLIAYTKTAPGPDIVLIVVNLQATRPNEGWVHLDVDALGIDADRPFALHDLLHGVSYEWRGATNYVVLDPATPAHLFHLVPPG